MTFHATTTVDIYRGETTDDYGDPVDTDAPLYTNIPASIIEQSKQSKNQDTGVPETVRSYRGRLYAGQDIEDDDRIRDRTTGYIYVVDGLQQPASPAWIADISLDLRRIT